METVSMGWWLHIAHPTHLRNQTRRLRQTPRKRSHQQPKPSYCIRTAAASVMTASIIYYAARPAHYRPPTSVLAASPHFVLVARLALVQCSGLLLAPALATGQWSWGAFGCWSACRIQGSAHHYDCKIHWRYLVTARMPDRVLLSVVLRVAFVPQLKICALVAELLIQN
jgi:hypothetical protein